MLLILGKRKVTGAKPREFGGYLRTVTLSFQKKSITVYPRVQERCHGEITGLSYQSKDELY